MRRETVKVLEYGRFEALLRVRYEVAGGEYDVDEDWPDRWSTDPEFDLVSRSLEVAERDWLYRSAFRRSAIGDSPAIEQRYAEFARMMLSHAPWRSERVYYLAGKTLEGAVEAGYDFPHAALELLELLAADRAAYRKAYEESLEQLEAANQQLSARIARGLRGVEHDLSSEPSIGEVQSPPAAEILTSSGFVRASVDDDE